MTYRASLGTRGELRRIAAEAENVTIDHVRPWIRKVQPCRLASHVIVPQWIRLEKPVKPKPPPPLVSHSRIVSGELIEEVLESATAKKFRRGRGRRGRPRKRAESNSNPELKSSDAGESLSDVAPATSEPAPEAGQRSTDAEDATPALDPPALEPAAEAKDSPEETAKDLPAAPIPSAGDENMMDTEKPEESVSVEDQHLNVDQTNTETAENAQPSTNDISNQNTQPTAEPPLEKLDSQIPEDSPTTSEPAVAEPVGPVEIEENTETQKTNQDVEMAEPAQEVPEASS